MSAYAAIIISALINGIFIGFLIKTGIDASPSGIGLQIIENLEPYLPTKLDFQVEFIKIFLVFIPWILTVVGILKANNKIAGLILYVIIFSTITTLVSAI